MSIAALKELKRTIIAQYVKPSDFKGFVQLTTTLLPLVLLWQAVAWTAAVSYWLTAALVPLMALFLLRVFVLMHECGHSSLFRHPALNRGVGFLLGVLSGMPQHVWSMHHLYHHTTNGNWDKYRGPLNIVTVEAFLAMSASQQKRYQRERHIAMAPLAGFLYLIFNPRLNLLKGLLAFVSHLIQAKRADPTQRLVSLSAGFKTHYWHNWQEFRHMLANNIVLVLMWFFMAWLLGPVLFFVVYVISLSLAGAGGILLFTVQHNFEHAYASGDEGWDYDVAAIQGTSFLVLPRWLNWFTANIAYHHIHHFSARIPNYCLQACHQQYAHVFTDVRRVSLSQIPRALEFVLWDKQSRCIVSIAEAKARASFA